MSGGDGSTSTSTSTSTSAGVVVGRAIFGAVGLVSGAWGLWLLLATGWDNVVAAGAWLVGGVIVHDAVLAPVTVLVAAVVLRVVPTRVRGRVAAAGLVAATITVVALPVLGRPGAEADNPSLLPRNYVLGWASVLVLVVVVTVALSLLDRRRAGAPDT